MNVAYCVLGWLAQEMGVVTESGLESAIVWRRRELWPG